MKTFTDSAGRTWTLAMNVAAAKRVKGLLGVDLLQLEAGSPPLITRLGTDVILLCDVLYALVAPQAETSGVSDEQFGQALGGDAILAAQRAFWEELVDFFHRLSRDDVVGVITKQRTAIELAVSRVAQEIGALSAERMVAQAFGEASTSSPASPASIPTP